MQHIISHMTNEELSIRLSPETAKMILNEEVPDDEKAYSRMSIKIGKSGCVSLYGLSRIPLNLYKNQWIKLWHVIDDVKDFIIINDKFLKGKKDDKPKEVK